MDIDGNNQHMDTAYHRFSVFCRRIITPRLPSAGRQVATSDCAVSNRK
jgi:hypothetical protein